MRVYWKQLRPGLAIVTGLLALAALACGGAPEATPAPAPQTQPTATVPPAAPAAPTATQAPASQAAPTATSVPAAAPSPTAAQAAQAEQPKGTLTIAITSVQSPSGFPTDCLWCASLTVVSAQEGILRTGRAGDGSLTAEPWLARSWKAAPDLSYTDFHLQQGVQFHKGFGELTAEDIQWTYHAIIPSKTSEARHDSSAEIDIAIKEVEVIDRYTARFHWDKFAGHTLVQIFTDSNEGTGMFPKKAFDDMGGEWMRTNVVGTGPFVMDEWTAQKGMFMTAFVAHWEKVPFVEKVRILEVPEPATRRAMMESGEAAIGGITLKDWPEMLGTGKFAKAPEGTSNVHGFPFGGNFWEWTHPVTGEVLETQRRTDLPWVGNPFENGPEFDPNTPSMQRSLKVRQALNMTIDREAINDVILKSLGQVAYLGGQQLPDPIWQANKDKWSVPFDEERAKQLLREAGYEGGFTVLFWAGLTNEDIEISEAIAADWLRLFNVRAEHDRRTYSTIRPGLVTRTFPVLRMHSCCNGPATWPTEFIWSSVGRGGYNHGLELPLASEVNEIKNNTTDPAVLQEVTINMRQYLHDWALLPAIVESPANAIYNTQLIESWQMRPFVQWRHDGIRQLEWVKLK